MSSEWVQWHEGYAPGKPLSRRLVVVQRMISSALDAAPPGPIRVISMCAGDGRDLLGVLPQHTRSDDVSAFLVELDPPLAAAARERASALGLASVEVRLADAGTTDAYAGWAPADLILACGIFGNVSDDDVRHTVRTLRSLCAPAATVIWTRGTFEPDLTPRIRDWFGDAGFAELEFVAIPGTTVGVGAHRLAAPPQSFTPGVRMFTFLEAGERPADIARQRAQSSESASK